jgi:hypothetical protein
VVAPPTSPVTDAFHPFAGDSRGPTLLVPGVENPDWGYARNKQVVLMSPSAEWAQSVFSCQFETHGRSLVAPNRDYPYQGLLACLDGENWKFIDCIALGLRDRRGRYRSLLPSAVPPTVEVDPWKVTYRYRLGAGGGGEAGGDPIAVSYYLCSRNHPETITGCVELCLPAPPALERAGLTAILQPFLDLRHMYGASTFSDYRLSSGSDGGTTRIGVSNGGRTICFFLQGFEAETFDAPQGVHWRYKLGTGSRCQRSDPGHSGAATVFRGEEKEVASFFAATVPAGAGASVVRLVFSCGLGDAPDRLPLARLEEEVIASRRADREQLEEVGRLFPVSAPPAVAKAIAARIIGLTKFKTYVRLAGSEEPVQVPHAGAWWFRTPWYRDAFEGILSSFETLMALPAERAALRRLVLAALGQQDPASGRIPTRVPEFRDLEVSYDNSDATLLCFTAANAWFARTGDLDFARRVAPHLETAVERFLRPSPTSGGLPLVDGPPIVDGGSGLLLSVVHHSWIDTRSKRLEAPEGAIEDLPSRLSQRFLESLYERVGGRGRFAELLASPAFFLPEVNAQWIRMLAGGEPLLAAVAAGGADGERGRYAALGQTLAELCERARGSFKRRFWNAPAGFLYNALCAEPSLADEIECETAVAAAAMLGSETFSHGELRAVWERARTRLLVERRLVELGADRAPFGVLTKNEAGGAFYDDEQYHGDVVWPRSTPYLITLLGLLGETETIREILLNTLDHQVSEGALFYNHELFSRPLGNNPNPVEATRDNPVPVKNPVQFWSQWCDPFVEFFR